MQNELRKIEELTLKVDNIEEQIKTDKSEDKISDFHLNVGMVVKVPGNMVGEIKKVDGKKNNRTT